MKKINRSIMAYFCLSSVFLQGVNFLETITQQRIALENQIKSLTKAGDDLLMTGSTLQRKLIDEINKQKKDLSEKQEVLNVPYSIVVEPFKFFETNITKEWNEKLAKANNQIEKDFINGWYTFLINNIRGALFQSAYNAIFTESLKLLKIPSLPDVLKNIMVLLQKVDGTMGGVAAKFEPIVRDIDSYVDIEQAKKDLQLPVNSYTTINLEFVNTYREYVNKVYAEKTGGGKFDSRGIYSGLWSAIESFKNAVIRLKKIETFLASFKLKK